MGVMDSIKDIKIKWETSKSADAVVATQAEIKKSI